MLSLFQQKTNMKELLKRLMPLQNKAAEKNHCPIVTVNSYESDDTIQTIRVDVTYTDSIGDVSDKRHFVTTFSCDDLPSITEKKFGLLEEYIKQANCVYTMITNLAETEE